MNVSEVTVSEVSEIVGYVCNRCFLGDVPKDKRYPCEFCKDWSDGHAAHVQATVKRRIANGIDVMKHLLMKVVENGNA